MTNSFWESVHKVKYDGQDWTKKPSIFVQEAIESLPKHGLVLELGAGQGQDSIFFRKRNYEVISSDNELSIIERADQNAHEYFNGSYGPMRFQLIDISNIFPLDSNFVDVVYAHLSLHYFDYEVTKQVFSEIYRVLKPGGVLAFLVNSTNDPEFNTGVKLEDHFFETSGTKKRYFSINDALGFTKEFEVILCDDKGETYKDSAKGVHNLIRFIGRKP